MLLLLFYLFFCQAAKETKRLFFCLDTKETKDQWPPDKKLKTTSQKRALAEPFALQAHF
jgi:hypothetical protein